jgi:hypothetical protein
MVDNPSWWKRADLDEDNGLTDPDQDQFNIDRRSFSRFLSKHKSVIPYYLHRDGVNYGGRPGGGSSRPWNNRPYGLSRLTHRFGLMPMHTRSGPFGNKWMFTCVLIEIEVIVCVCIEDKM